MFDIVIPIYNEEENINFVFNEIKDLSIYNHIIKIIFVNDCSIDNSEEKIKVLKKKYKKIEIINHSVKSGQSRAINTGILCSKSEVIMIIDGDGQILPKDIVNIYNALFNKKEKKYSLISGNRKNRKDNIFKIISSRIAFLIRKIMLGDDCIDTGCPLKIFFRNDYLKLPYFDNMHRFLPILFKREGFNIKYLDIGHRRRFRGKSKYGIMDRLFIGISDLFGVRWLIRRKKSNLKIV